jgi:hypothetical protein
VLVTGATGYISRYVVRELLRRGHRVLAVARARSGIRGRNSPEDVVADLAPAQVVFSDVTDPAVLLADLSAHGPVHAAVCCLTSRGGGEQGWEAERECGWEGERGPTVARAGSPQDQLSARARFDVAEGREEGGAELELERGWEAEQEGREEGGAGSGRGRIRCRQGLDSASRRGERRAGRSWSAAGRRSGGAAGRRSGVGLVRWRGRLRWRR